MNTTCHHCGADFTATNRRGITPRFCSNACKQKAYRARNAASPFPATMTKAARWTRADGKRPVQADGRPASTTNPDTWAEYRKVRAGSGDGMGFMLGGGIGCYDLDHVTDDQARDFLATVTEPIVYVERSVSGTGVHIYIEAEEAQGWRRGNIERYTRQRFIRTTGNTFDWR